MLTFCIVVYCGKYFYPYFSHAVDQLNLDMQTKVQYAIQICCGCLDIDLPYKHKSLYSLWNSFIQHHLKSCFTPLASISSMCMCMCCIVS